MKIKASQADFESLCKILQDEEVCSMIAMQLFVNIVKAASKTLPTNWQSGKCRVPRITVGDYSRDFHINTANLLLNL